MNESKSEEKESDFQICIILHFLLLTTQDVVTLNAIWTSDEL